jgi:RimJ/RimL family protein N-acetyltransferase
VSLRREVSRRRIEKVSAGDPPAEPLRDGGLTLRLPSPEDIAAFVRYGSDDALLDGIWILGPQGQPVSAWASELVAELAGGWTPSGGDHGGGLIIDEVEPCVGVVDFLPRQAGHVELTYGVAPPFRGCGIATRAAALAADWALREGGFACVELRIGEGHAASRRVAEKAGFQCVERYQTFVEGTGLTHVDCLYVRGRH